MFVKKNDMIKFSKVLFSNLNRAATNQDFLLNFPDFLLKFC